MAKVFYFCKRFSEQGNPVAPVTMSDYILYSRPITMSNKYRLGFKTWRTSLSKLKDYSLQQIILNGHTTRINVGTGLLGSGEQRSPLQLDEEWLTRNFTTLDGWNYTQVGDPSDVTLPVSGSYMSVAYPHSNDPFPPCAFVEGNGDLRLFRHVTNGETFRVVYSTWKNYRNTDIETISHTDIEYRPPGLASDEYIHNVYQSDGRAMIVEIYNASGFREFAFINLQYTGIAQYHVMTRLGHTPITTLMGKTYSVERHRQLRSAGLMATIIQGRLFIGCVMPRNSEENDVAVQFAFAEVTEAGTVTRIRNWTTTNTNGLVRTSTDFALIHQKIETSLPTDQDALYEVEGSKVWTAPDVVTTGATPGARASWGRNADDTTLTIVLSTHHQMMSNTSSEGVHGYAYYIVDLIGRTVVPEPRYGRGLRMKFTLGVDESIVVSNKRNELLDEDKSTASARFIQPLINGDRFRSVVSAGETSVHHRFYIYTGPLVRDPQDVAGDALYTTGTITYTLDAQHPTVIRSGFAASLMYNNLVQYDSYTMDEHTGGANYAKLNGAATARQYSLLLPDTFAQRVTYQGYDLNNERGAIATTMTLNINSLRKDGQVYYHTATWSKGTPRTKTFGAKYDQTFRPLATYSCEQGVYDAMETFIAKYKANGSFNEVETADWMIIPPYPGLGHDYAVYKVIMSWRVKDAADPRGYRYSNMMALTGIIPATYRTDTSGNVILTSVDTAKIQANWINVGTTYRLAVKEAYLRGTGSAIDIEGGRVYALLQTGSKSSTHYAKGDDGWRGLSFVCDTNGSNLTQHGPATFDYQSPVVHTTHGLGVVTTVGLSAFYVFIPVLKNTMRLDSNIANHRILGSGRPAEGFSLNITSPIDVVISGRKYVIPVQTRDLTQVTANYKNATFYYYAVVFNGKADLIVSTTVLVERQTQIFLGTIKTSATGISEISSPPVTRWENARPSITPIGNAIPVSTGTADMSASALWVNAQSSGGGEEYMWGSDDIIDADLYASIDDVYWSTNAQGTDRITNWEYGKDFYLIVKTTGITGNVNVGFDADDLYHTDLATGTIAGNINVPITYNPVDGSGYGSYKLTTWEYEEMAFKSSRWQNVTGSRAIGGTYTNNTGFEIQVAAMVQAVGNARYYILEVDGVAVDTFKNWGIGGTAEVQLQAIIPPNSTYRLYTTAGSGGLVSWMELRRG